MIPGPRLRGIVAPARDVDDEQPVVHQIEGEGGGEIVAAALDQDQVEGVELLLQQVGGLDVERRVLADHRMGAGAGLDTHDPLRRDQAAPLQPLGILPRHQVVGDNGERGAARREEWQQPPR